MQIFLKGRRLIALDMEPSDTIYTLKTRIHDREGIPPRYLLLTYACKILEDERTLDSYGIVRESTVEFRVRAFVPEPDPGPDLVTPNDPPAPE
jgi:hypothetical protein